MRRRVEEIEAEDATLLAGWMYADLLLGLMVIFLATISFVPIDNFVSKSLVKATYKQVDKAFNFNRGISLIYDKFDAVALEKDISSFKKREGLDNDAEFEQLDTDLETEVSSRLDPWLGLLDVDLHIDQELKSVRNDRVRELGEVIEEIISNSMRHGKAQKVALRVFKSGDRDIQIIASDDATIAPPQVQSRYGLGTRIFNLASDGRWSITRVESGTEFKLTMAMEL